MARRQAIAALAALLLAALLTPPAITRASAGEGQTPPAAPAAFDELTVTFAYPTSVGEAVTSDGRTIKLDSDGYVRRAFSRIVPTGGKTAAEWMADYQAGIARNRARLLERQCRGANGAF